MVLPRIRAGFVDDHPKDGAGQPAQLATGSIATTFPLVVGQNGNKVIGRLPVYKPAVQSKYFMEGWRLSYGKTIIL